MRLPIIGMEISSTNRLYLFRDFFLNQILSQPREILFTIVVLRFFRSERKKKYREKYSTIYTTLDLIRVKKEKDLEERRLNSSREQWKKRVYARRAKESSGSGAKREFWEPLLPRYSYKKTLP